MKMNNSVKLIFASALLLTAASCAKDVALQVPGESPVSFDVTVEGEGLEVSEVQDGTKAALKGGFTDGDIFKVYAYDGSTAVMSGVSVTKSSSGWACTGGPYLWTKGKSLNFYAFYPESSEIYRKISSTGVASFTYSPLSDGGKDVNGQTDYMLASYKGTGNNGTVPLSFSHMLSSIQFKCGSFDATFGTISSIEIRGFYDYGTCTPTCGETGVSYSWSSQNYSFKTLNQTGLSVTPASDAAIGMPFVLIPGQNFSTSGRSLNVTVKSSTGRTATGTLSQNTALAAGKTSVFKINYIDGDKITFSPVTVTAWGSNEGGSADAEELPILPGVFSVSDNYGTTIKKVHFSKGNLWYNGSIFRFETNQYDFRSTWSTSHVSHFYWSKTESVAYAESYSESGTTVDDVLFTNATTTTAKSDFVVEGVEGKFRTLSRQEWEYLFKFRTSAESKYGYATVGVVHGLIILPDTFTDPMKNNGSGAFVPQSTTGWDANVYTTGGNWEAMEAAGAVFLPAAGGRNGSGFSDVGSVGYYWLSYAGFMDLASRGSFNSSEVSTYVFSSRNRGYCVRLVMESN